MTVMGKAASHFIRCSGHVYHLHYMEWDENGRLSGIFPLQEEIAGVVFFNGTLVPVPSACLPEKDLQEEDLQELSAKVETGSTIHLFHIDQKMTKVF